jgi:carbamoyl-phosphate synthase large subunit
LKVLVTSAGRRTSLIRGFLDAVSGIDGGRVYASDADPLAPGLFVADKGMVLPPLAVPGYEEDLISVCEHEGIGLVVPTIDTELPILSKISEELAAVGAMALVSAPAVIAMSRDKGLTEDVFAASGIATPRSYPLESIGDLDLPDRVFIKPRSGSASVGAHVVERADIATVVAMVDDPIIQDYVDAAEITVDALLDLHGNVIHMVPRIRIKTVGGESIQGVTMPDEPIRPWLLGVLAVVGGLGGVGPITVQAFLTEGSPTLVEVNPRFGGGFPLTLQAGGDYPAWIISMVSGDELTPRLGEYRRLLFMTRFLDEIYVDSATLV